MSRRHRNRGGRGSGDLLALLAFIAIMLLGLALMLRFILGAIDSVNDGISGWIERVALAIAIFIPALLSYREARRRGTVWFVLWVIAIILVVVFYILAWL